MGRRKKLADRATRHDPAYRRAKREGYAGRAVYKLQELEARFRLLGPGKRVLDLGCWPGSWLQLAADSVGPDGLVVGIDLKPVDIALPPWVETVVADIERVDPAKIRRRWGTFDVVLSDMAPQTSGDRRTDQWRSEALLASALTIAEGVLRSGGHFAGKVFQGPEFDELLARLRAGFQEAKPFRPKSTRNQSIEQYLIGRGHRGQ